MNNRTQPMMNFTPPFRSVALALVFGALLGPIGLLYSSLLGGIIMMVFGLFLLRAKLFALLILVWLISCVLNVAAANRYNQKLLFLLLKN